MCKTILIINKDLNTNSLLSKKIIKNNPEFKIRSTVSCLEGIELAEKYNPYVIIIGSMLLETDSITVCSKLKSNENTLDIPLIFLTPLSVSSEFQKSAVNAGADAFLREPFDDTELNLLLRAMIKIKNADKRWKEEKNKLERLSRKNTAELAAERKTHIRIEKALIESEQRYRLLIENQNDLIVKFDKNQNVQYVNPNYCNCFGLDETEIIGKKFFPLVHKDDLEIVKKSIEELEFPPHNSYHEERDKTVNGWRWFGWSKKALLNGKGEIIEVVAVGRDITDRKEIQQKLIENEISLRELNATKDKFFSIIAHDLKGPFNTILGFSELIIEKCQKNDFKDVGMMSGLLHSSAKHSYELLTNLLVWSRAQGGKKIFQPKEIQLVPLLKTEIELVSLTAQEKNIKINCNCQETTVFADYNMLHTIMRNLISNALKYSFKGGEININVQRNDKEVMISVADYGVGIAEEKRNKLFNISDVESTRGTNNEKGTGLGLILCKEFIENHGGEIWVESREGLGSTFSFTLPFNP